MSHVIDLIYVERRGKIADGKIAGLKLVPPPLPSMVKTTSKLSVCPPSGWLHLFCPSFM